jgi:U3 small nucleolar RNA-associated protein 10
LLVDTIRGTSNSQLQNSALLLVSCLAAWRPDDVLHSVMPIFTFMGSNILRQGDDYSAHVIEQTVSRVVPPIVSSLKKTSKDVVSGVADLLLSFTAAFEHIPSHRRLVLFERVVNALGPEECLSAVIVMIVDRISTDRSTNQFVLDLMGFYDSNINLKVRLIHLPRSYTNAI